MTDISRRFTHCGALGCGQPMDCKSVSVVDVVTQSKAKPASYRMTSPVTGISSLLCDDCRPEFESLGLIIKPIE